MKILITICARGGSKGIPKKNIRQLNNIPLIGYSINTSQKFKLLYPESDIVLSTDSLEIREVASQLGLLTDYIRPESLATDKAGKMGVIKDVLKYQETLLNKKYDYVLDLDVTSPLRTTQDLDEALKIINDDKKALTLFSVSPAHRNPYFNMVEKKKNGYYGLIKNFDSSFLTRQSAPEVYDMNASFYFYKKSFFERDSNSCITEYSKIYEVPHTCFDLDNPIDFDFMEFLLKNNKLDFSL